MQNLEHPIRFSDCILTLDRAHWFSLSYRGMSSRGEMWVTLILLLVLWGVVCACVPARGGEPVVQAVVGSLLKLLLLFPLLIRRARQMGATIYGVLVALMYATPAFFSWCVYFSHGYMGDDMFSGADVALQLLALLPLLILGGNFSGCKNELHRASMAGDRERVERILALYPSMVNRRSEAGYTPAGYAQMSGHRELSCWLREREEAFKIGTDD